MEYLSKSLEETAEIAANFAKATLAKKEFSDKATVVGLYGELGSGKTTFMKYLAEALGVGEEITSPTFVIMKNFNLKGASKKAQGGEETFKLVPFNFQTLVHIDAYRIENEEEMLVLGWEEIIADPKNLICIEWPEKIVGILPEHIVVKFDHVSEGQRKISIA